MKRLYFTRNSAVVILMDTVLISLAFYLSHQLRFDFNVPRFHAVPLWQTFPVILLIKLVVFYYSDFYRGMWRYTSVSDLIKIVKATVFSSLIIIGAVLFMNRFENIPRSVFLIDWLLTVLSVSAFRIIVRLYYEYNAGGNVTVMARSFLAALFRKGTPTEPKRLLIIGAGNCGEKILREIQADSRLGYVAVGFLDDNPAKVGMKIHGVTVLNAITFLNDVVAKEDVDEIVIAVPSATADQMRTIVRHCEESGIRFRTVPGYGELVNGKVSISAAREVAYQDLLGREAITLDRDRIGAYLMGKTVIITGAGGSIGSELSRQVCRFHPRRVILFERAETSLYEIDLELRDLFRDADIAITSVLGDIQDRSQLEAVFEKYAPQVVFHAAAYKHVPILEAHPWKAVKNNIYGTQNLVEVSKKYAVERFVFVSTDKAVRPANVMGASKRIAEILLQSQNGTNQANTQFKIVRFGNVIGSAGSVIPLFKKQIARGGPVTVTHPEVTRYFMTIPEACQLILQAGAITSEQGASAEVYILKMGTPVKIVDMARDLIRLSGFRPDVDIRIEYTGLRPGEKLFEELMIEGEGVVPTSHTKILVLNGHEADLAVLNEKILRLMEFAENQEDGKIRAMLKEIVPEYQPGEKEWQTGKA
ncbi:MAG: nucleoside-diphosphate sugar epimerase/dehydratase [Thermodesulfobacteriota bacterium]